LCFCGDTARGLCVIATGGRLQGQTLLVHGMLPQIGAGSPVYEVVLPAPCCSQNWWGCGPTGTTSATVWLSPANSASRQNIAGEPPMILVNTDVMVGEYQAKKLVLEEYKERGLLG
jgi:hypothetical protein